MRYWPRITLVTPSFNQGRFITETIESVITQNYPNLEYIIVDGGSKDDTLQILEQYKTLKVVSEPDRGQGDAINKGFHLATGEIFGYLNSDDTLLPETLLRVASEIDPINNRHIIMGRCRFINEQSRFIGIEHPSRFKSHRRVLEIWKGHTIPQPAVFWTREVWENCGPMDVDLKYHWIDYDLFCRFSKKYHFYFIDQVFATYRIYLGSKTSQRSEDERLQETIWISRRFWGSPQSIQFWLVSLSLAWFRFDRRGRSKRLFRHAQESWKQRQFLKCIGFTLGTCLVGPDVVLYLGIYGPFLRMAKGLVKRAIPKLTMWSDMDPRTKMFLDNVSPWEDGWVGPNLEISYEIMGSERELVIEGWADPKFLGGSLELTFEVDRQEMGRFRVTKGGEFTNKLRFKVPLPHGSHMAKVKSNRWQVPHRLNLNGDFRPLSWRLINFRVE